MGRTSSIDHLPDDLKEQLVHRLFDSKFSDYEGHEEWTASQGFRVSKSAIHRYAQAIERQLADPALRLSCAQVAARYSDGDSIIENSSRLLVWVVSRKP